MPSLSVIVPSRDTRELTLAALAALARQSRPAEQILLVDDGSRDGTREAVAERFPDVEVVALERSLGFSAAVNRGLEQADGDLLLLLNSDTEVEEAGLQALVAAFAGAPDLGAVGAELHYPDGSPQWSGGAEPTVLWLFALASGLPRAFERLPGYRRLRPLAAPGARDVGWVTGAALGLRARACEEVGMLDEDYAFYAQDLDYCCRLRAAGWRVSLDPRFRVLHHHGATVGRREATVGGKQYALLWRDLMRWGGKHRSRSWCHAARASLELGGRLRLARCRLRGGRRREREEEISALRAALTGLSRQGEP